jgi:hypothetical protein
MRFGIYAVGDRRVKLSSSRLEVRRFKRTRLAAPLQSLLQGAIDP